MKKILLITLFCMIFLVSTVSAATWDDWKFYDDKTQTYSIDNTFGLGKNIAELELITSIDKNVGAGYQRVAEIEIRNGEFDYDDIIKGIELYNINDGMKEFTRDVDYKIKTLEEVPTYVTECNPDIINGTICSQVQKGTRQKVVWKDWDKTMLKQETITLGLFTNVKKGDYVEWILEVYGDERLVKWATWKATMDADNVGYYRLEEVAGGVVDATGHGYDGSNNGADRGVPGRVDLAFDFERGVADWVNITGVGFNDAFTGTDISFNMWFKPESYPNLQLSKMGQGKAFAIQIENGGLFSFQTIGGGGGWKIAKTTQNYTAGSWYMITGVYNGSHNLLYVNGTFKAKILSVGLGGTPDKNYLALGSNFGGGFHFDGVIDEVGLWNRTLNTTEITDLYNGGAGLLYGASIPTVNLITPIDTASELSPITFNISASSGAGSLVNITLYLNTSGANGTQTWTGNWNSTTFTRNLPVGVYNWTALVCNDKPACVFSASNYTITVTSFTQNSLSYKPFTYETAQETFSVNLTTNGSAIVNPFIVFNNSMYEATITNTGNFYNLSKTIDIPIGFGNTTFYFNFTLGGVLMQTGYNQQHRNYTNYSYCGGVGGTQEFLNFSFLDETTGLVLNSTNDLVDTTFWLGSGSITKSFVSSNTSLNWYYDFCLFPKDREVITDTEFKYSRPGYPIRTFAYDEITLANTTTNQTLYMLATADGIYSSIQVIETAGGPIQSVGVSIERQFSGLWTLVGQGTTGGDGLVTFWINPNFQHRITAIKTGYVNNQVIITPSQTLYTMTLQRTTENATYVSDIPGIRWIVRPAIGSLEPGLINFNATVISTESNLVNCKFQLINTSDITNILATTTAITNSSYCFLNIAYLTTANNNIFGKLFLHTIESGGFVVVDADWKWIIIDIDIKGWRTITSFISELKNIGEFGEGNKAEFSVMVFFFLITTILIGVFTYFTGAEVNAPGMTILIIWFIVAIASVAGFLTFASGSDRIGAVMQQYGFFFIYTLLALSFIINTIRKVNE